MEKLPEGGTHSEMSGTAGDLVQARDVHGGIHFHRPATAVPVPRQLPWDKAGFVNRLEALDALDAAASDSGPKLAVIVGMPGVGKTSLALQWSQRNLGRFPDGQLYVNLHSYDPEPPVSPPRALGRFLLALGVPRGEITSDPDEAAALYRSLAAGRRMLILLDNAAGAGQVRPLLPGAGVCTVLVTSRDRMSGLVARDGARRIILDVLPESDAVELLESVTRAERPAEPAGRLAELAGLCARLPLALRIAAEHALRRPWMNLGDLTAELRNESALWKTLTAEEGSDAGITAARSVFAWSYQSLPEDAATAFRALAQHPGPDFCGAAAAALTGTEGPPRSLDALVGAHLLKQSGPDRYQFHDLVRSYAMDQARHEEPPGNLRNATRRVLAWYLRSADTAQAWINPNEAHITFDAGDDDPLPEAFTSYDQAVAWYERERGNLMAAVHAAEGQHMYEIAWKLAVVLRAIYMRFNPFEDWIATSEAGLRAAETLGDRAAVAELLESLGMACAQSNDLDRSTTYHQRALQIRRQVDDRLGTALSLNDLGLVLLRRHQLTEAQAMFEESLAVFGELRDAHWQPVIRANLSEVLIGMERYDEAGELISTTLAVFRERGDAGGEGNALRLLSMLRRGLGDTAGALESAERAVALATEQHNTMWEGYWLLELGTIQRITGQLSQALGSFERSAFLQHRIGDKIREAQAWDGAGEVNRAIGQTATAINLHGRAADTFRRLGTRWLLAMALRNLAIAQLADGRTGQARETASEALQALTEFSDVAAQGVRNALREIPGNL